MTELSSPAVPRPLVLFDLDGCLVDSREPILQSWNVALASMDLAPVTATELDRYIGPPLQHTATEMLASRGAGGQDAPTFIARYRADYETRSIDLAATFPGIPEALDEIAAFAQLAVCTSKPGVYARPILEALELANRFDTVAGPDLTEAEPKSVTMVRVFDALGRHDVRDRGVMIGDRHHDIDAARHHGLRSIGVLWGFGSEDELRGAGAEAIVSAPSQLPDATRELLG